MSDAGPGKATLVQLVFMIYTAICGGAYGLEPMVSASGPGAALLTLVLLPVVWAAPMALVCAELSATRPVEGGYYRWVRAAFGDFVGYACGYLAWIALYATNALYVVLFVGYLEHWLPDLPPAGRIAIGAVLIWTAVLLNWLGIRLVGTTAVVMMVLVLLPFVAMTLLGFLQWRFDPTTPFTAPGKATALAFADGLLVAFWLYSGYEKLSVLAGEVVDPSRSFPRALAFAVPLSAASYVAPTLAGLAANGDWSAWGDSHFTAAAQAIGGAGLAALMAAGGLVSNAGLLLVTMTGQSRLPMVLAEDRLFPKGLARIDPRHGTPGVSLVLGGLVLTALSLFPFSQLIGIYGPAQALAYLLIYASIFRLRRGAPDVGGPGGGVPGPAPFRIPLGTRSLALLAAPGVALMVLVVVQGLGRELWRDGHLDVAAAALHAGVLGSVPVTFLWFRRRAKG
jgi:amino acid transporter